MASNNPNPGNSGFDKTDRPSIRRRYIEEWEADKEKGMFDDQHRLRRISEEVEQDDGNAGPEISFWNYIISAAYGGLLFTLVVMTSYGLTQLFNKYLMGYFSSD